MNTFKKQINSKEIKCCKYRSKKTRKLKKPSTLKNTQ